jgi:translation initiation factor 2 beta subunit (eIF-2beta)/eIF-5
MCSKLFLLFLSVFVCVCICGTVRTFAVEHFKDALEEWFAVCGMIQPVTATFNE